MEYNNKLITLLQNKATPQNFSICCWCWLLASSFNSPKDLTTLFASWMVVLLNASPCGDYLYCFSIIPLVDFLRKCSTHLFLFRLRLISVFLHRSLLVISYRQKVFNGVLHGVWRLEVIVFANFQIWSPWNSIDFTLVSSWLLNVGKHTKKPALLFVSSPPDLNQYFHLYQLCCKDRSLPLRSLWGVIEKYRLNVLGHGKGWDIVSL